MITPPRPTTLYRLFNADDQLLYVGIAGNPGRRWEQHRGDKLWWGDVARTTLEHFDTREEAERAEITAIKTEHPLRNIVHNRGGKPAPAPPLAPGATTWTWYSRRSGHQFTEQLALYWFIDMESITDDYYADEITASQLWRMWLRRLEGYDNWYQDRWGVLEIMWTVTTPEVRGVFDTAPFPAPDGIVDRFGQDSWLDFYSWPEDAATGERLNWLTLPVIDKQWNPARGDKGGFVQELTGWKPSPLQHTVHIPSLAAAAMLPRPTESP